MKREFFNQVLSSLFPSFAGIEFNSNLFSLPSFTHPIIFVSLSLLSSKPFFFSSFYSIYSHESLHQNNERRKWRVHCVRVTRLQVSNDTTGKWKENVVPVSSISGHGRERERDNLMTNEGECNKSRETIGSGRTSIEWLNLPLLVQGIQTGSYLVEGHELWLELLKLVENFL